MAKAKRGRKKVQETKHKSNIDVAVVGMIFASLLLGVLIYSKAGVLGEYLSPWLGSVMGIIKYIIPVGTFIIGISLACNKGKEYILSKLMLFF